MKQLVVILLVCSMSCFANAEDAAFNVKAGTDIPQADPQFSAPVSNQDSASGSEEDSADNQPLSGQFFAENFPKYHEPEIPAEWEWQHKSALINPDTWQPAFSRVAWQSEAISPDDDVYALAEARVSENLAVFVQLGQVDQQSVSMYEYVGTGIMLNNRWHSGDSIGMSVMRGNRDIAQPLIYSEWISTETAWEFTYIRPLVKRLNAQTSVYYIQNPADSSGAEAAIAAQVRFYYQF